METNENSESDSNQEKEGVPAIQKRLFKLGYFLTYNINKMSARWKHVFQIIEFLQLTAICFASRVISSNLIKCIELLAVR